MIEPTPKDVGRKVQWRGADGQVAGTGAVENFSAAYVFVRAKGQLDPMPRHQLEWVGGGDDPEVAARLAAARDATRLAARNIFQAAGLAVEELDEHTWRVEGFLFRPVLGTWSRPDGTPGYGGVRPLLAAIRAAGDAQRATPAAETPSEPSSGDA